MSNKDNKEKDQKTFVSPYMATVELGKYAEMKNGKYAVVLKGNKRWIDNKEFCFKVDGELSRWSIFMLLKGTQGVRCLKANYTFPEAVVDLRPLLSDGWELAHDGSIHVPYNSENEPYSFLEMKNDALKMLARHDIWYTRAKHDSELTQTSKLTIRYNDSTVFSGVVPDIETFNLVISLVKR